MQDGQVQDAAVRQPSFRFHSGRARAHAPAPWRMPGWLGFTLSCVSIVATQVGLTLLLRALASPRRADTKLEDANHNAILLHICELRRFGRRSYHQLLSTRLIHRMLEEWSVSLVSMCDLFVDCPEICIKAVCTRVASAVQSVHVKPGFELALAPPGGAVRAAGVAACWRSVFLRVQLRDSPGQQPQPAVFALALARRAERCRHPLLHVTPVASCTSAAHPRKQAAGGGPARRRGAAGGRGRGAPGPGRGPPAGLTSRRARRCSPQPSQPPLAHAPPRAPSGKPQRRRCDVKTSGATRQTRQRQRGGAPARASGQAHSSQQHTAELSTSPHHRTDETTTAHAARMSRQLRPNRHLEPVTPRHLDPKDYGSPRGLLALAHASAFGVVRYARPGRAAANCESGLLSSSVCRYGCAVRYRCDTDHATSDKVQAQVLDADASAIRFIQSSLAAWTGTMTCAPAPVLPPSLIDPPSPHVQCLAAKRIALLAPLTCSRPCCYPHRCSECRIREASSFADRLQPRNFVLERLHPLLKRGGGANGLLPQRIDSCIHRLRCAPHILMHPVVPKCKSGNSAGEEGLEMVA